MINGLGLFASLAGPEATTPPAPAEDPALFAAALVAALGLKQPVQIVEPVQPPVAGAASEEGEESSEGEARPGTVATTESEPDPKDAGVALARVTPDAEVAEETETLGKVLKATREQPEDTQVPGVEAKRVAKAGKAAAAPVKVDVTSDEPARPVALKGDPSQTSKAEASVAPVDSSAKAVRHAVPATKAGAIALPAELVSADSRAQDEVSKAQPLQAKPTAATPSTSQGWPAVPVASAPGEGPVCIVPMPDGEPPSPDAVELTDTAKRPIEDREPEAAAAPASPPPMNGALPVVQVPMPAAPVAGNRPAARTEDTTSREPGTDVRAVASNPGLTTKRTAAAAASAPARSAEVERLAAEYQAPPQSVEERTARAMAENNRLGRQLAELLGEADVTNVKVELAARSPTEAPVTPVLPPEADNVSAPVVWQRALPLEAGDTISGRMLPQVAPRGVRSQLAVEGTIANEAVDPVILPKSAPVITLLPVNNRPEIVRMVANASRAMAPNLTAPEGNQVGAKAPAPSMTSSLPVDRQELPAPAARDGASEADEIRRKESRAAAASDAPAATSGYAANNQPATVSRDGVTDTRDSREARNLPSHGSTDEKAAGSADRVTLQVADDEGRQTRIRVSVTGTQIRAVITPPDNASARQLEQRMDQLHETLVRQGFVDPKVIVRTAEAVSDAALMAGAGSEVRSAGPTGRDQPSGEQRQGRGQREQDRGDGHRHPQGHSRERDPRDRRR